MIEFVVLLAKKHYEVLQFHITLFLIVSIYSTCALI